MIAIFKMMCKIEAQGDDKYRSIWFSIERGNLADFGDYDEYLEAGEVENKKDFEDLWLYYYPEPTKWYAFAVAEYNDVIYFYIDRKLTLECNVKENNNTEDYSVQTDLINHLQSIVSETITQIQSSEDNYNTFISDNLPHKKRVGRIIRQDYWNIFPEYAKEFVEAISPLEIKILEKIKEQSPINSFGHLPQMTSGDFFRFCEMGYDANNYFENSSKTLTAKEKYYAMADGRDCGLQELNETSYQEFQDWHETKMNCGGHPWEICRGGNSTHISLFICKEKEGWNLRLEGSSSLRVIETIKIAVALYQHQIPFVLGKAEEIYKMAIGIDYIGIVPEKVIPRYCHSYFPKEDNIIDFMNLGYEKSEEIIRKAFWYPIDKIQLIR
jgi:hypothetical protein